MAKAPRVTLLLLIALAAAGLLANLDQPLVRNSLVYARAAEHVIAHGYDPRPVVADSRLSYDKPIGLSWLAAPLVAWLGNHHGLMLASFLGILAWLLAVHWFAGLPRLGLSPGERAWLQVLSSLSPLSVYQSWSAHPDGLFAALYLAAAGSACQLVDRPGVLRAVPLLLAIVASMLLKNYAMILLPCCGLFLLWHVRGLWSAPGGRGAALAAAVALALPGALALLAFLGHNPLLRVTGEGGGAEQDGRGVGLRSALGTGLQCGLTLLVNLHCALPLLLRGTAWRLGSAARLLWCFPVPYVLGLIPFPHTFYNMRYFLPVVPFVALLLVHGARGVTPAAARLVRAAFATVALALVAVFNLTAVWTVAGPWLPRLELDWAGPPLSLLDNLRMPLHRQQAAVLAHLNGNVPAGAVLYLLDVSYYRDAQQGVFERAGQIRGDITTRYASSRDFRPAEPCCYVFGRLRDPDRLRALGEVTDLGRDLFRIVAPK